MLNKEIKISQKKLGLARYGKGSGDLDKDWSQPPPSKPKPKEKIDGAATMKSKDEFPVGIEQSRFSKELRKTETSKHTPLLFGKDTT